MIICNSLINYYRLVTMSSISSYSYWNSLQLSHIRLQINIRKFQRGAYFQYLFPCQCHTQLKHAFSVRFANAAASDASYARCINNPEIAYGMHGFVCIHDPWWWCCAGRPVTARHVYKPSLCPYCVSMYVHLAVNCGFVASSRHSDTQIIDISNLYPSAIGNWSIPAATIHPGRSIYVWYSLLMGSHSQSLIQLRGA